MTKGRGNFPRLFRGLLVLCGILLSPSTPAGAQDTWQDIGRIVVVGDIHGDFEKFRSILRTAGLINRRGKWIGGETHLVQLGDVPDRGPATRKIIELLMRLERQANKEGGKVHALIGNHEAMNVYGDLRYVTSEEFAAFRTRRSRRLRDDHYDRTLRYIRETSPEEEWPDFNDEFRAAWEANHPLGYVEHRLAWQPEGEYGGWIRGHHALIRINRTLFLHGGISPQYAFSTPAQINSQVRAELSDLPPPEDGILLDEDGPLWYRGLALGAEAELQAHVDAVLESYEVDRIVIGHTPFTAAIYPRFEGKVILADVGLSSYFGGREAFLIIEGDRLTAVHRGQRIGLPDGSSDDLLRYLRQVAELEPVDSPIHQLIATLETPSATGTTDMPSDSQNRCP